MKEYISVLKNYIPEEAAKIIALWIKDSGCKFKISKSRLSKFGDYRPPHRDKGHRISVNHDLNPYAFLITTVHEFAHLKTWNEHKHLVKPHGLTWKRNFKELMNVFFELQIFPEDIIEAVQIYLRNPKASSCTDIHLFRTLKRYDQAKESNHHTIETLPASSVFSLKNGRIFQKGEKLRKRYRCVEVKTGRVYLFNPIAEVQLMKNSG
jgi:hypothetical protein